jgi:hypothetical protein
MSVVNSRRDAQQTSGSSQPGLLLPVRILNIGLLMEMGKQCRKHIKRLKRGGGRLNAQIEAALDDARKELGIDPLAEIVPIVILYRYLERDYVVSSSQD